MIKAYIYCRVSGVGQVDGGGFDRQEDTCRSYATRTGYEIAAIYREPVTGTRDETARPVFQEMITAILTNGVHTVIVEGLDRLARELRIQETLLIYLAAKNIDLISARTEENVTQAIQQDPLKKALIQIQGVFSELEKNQIVRRLRLGRDKTRKETGRCEGRFPYGQTPEEQEIVKRIKLLRKTLTLQAIADRLNAETIPTCQESSKFHPRKTKGWTPGQIWQILNRKKSTSTKSSEEI